MSVRTKEVWFRRQINLLRSRRAGSIFPEEFEAGWIYGLLWVLDEEPPLQTREEVLKWIRETVGKDS